MKTIRRQPTAQVSQPSAASSKPAQKLPQSYADSCAMLDYLLDGKALPSHLSRSPVGTVISRSPRMQESFAQQQAREAAARAKAAAEKMEKAPLVKVCYSHVCDCGASWQAFGFYARRGHIDDYRAGAAIGMKRLDYRPTNEPVTETIWQTVEEHACMACADDTTGGPIAAPDSLSPAIISQYRHKAAEEVEAIREDALNQRIAAYAARAVKRVAAVLPYGLEDSIPALPELLSKAQQAADAE